MADNNLGDNKSMEVIKSLLMEGITSVYVLDGSGRIQEQYDGYTDIKLGNACLKTEYKFQDGALGNSRKVIASNESIAPWPGYEVVQVGAGNDFDALL
jgi:hypothetical protein